MRNELVDALRQVAGSIETNLAGRKTITPANLAETLLALADQLDGTIAHAKPVATKRMCLACSERPAATLPDYPALCGNCLDRSGEQIEPGCRVVCEVDENCSGTVDRVQDDLAVVKTADGGEAWVPVQQVVRITG